MIDAENMIYSEIAATVAAKYPKVFITGEYVKAPSSFPCVSFIEVDNVPYRNSRTTDSGENHVAVSYELNVYSNKKTGKKAECKAITALIDNALMGLNFTRIMLEPIPNQDDAIIYRILGRYRAVISKDKVVYRR